jgi:hypothetical protein
VNYKKLITNILGRVSPQFLKQIEIFSLILCVFYFIIRFIDRFFLSFKGIGDEIIFINDLKYFIDHGYSNAVIEGTSIPLMVLSSFVFKIISDYSLALRISSCICTFILVFYLFYKIKFTNKVQIIHLLFLLGTATTATLGGQNDSIFFMGMLIFYFEATMNDSIKKTNIILMSFCSAIMIMSRPVIIIYGLIFFAGFTLYRIMKKEITLNSKNKYVLVSMTIGLFITTVANLPRLTNDSSSIMRTKIDELLIPFSYSGKTQTKPLLRENTNLTWIEWLYISQYIGNNNNLGFLHPLMDLDEAEQYKMNNPEIKTPKTFSEYLTQHKKFILKRLPISLVEIVFYSIRSVGLLFLLIPFIIYFKLKRKTYDEYFLSYLTVLIGAIVLAVLWPTAVRSIHIYPLYFILTICFLKDEEISFINEYKNFIIPINLTLINTIIIWSLWKEKLFYHI